MIRMFPQSIVVALCLGFGTASFAQTKAKADPSPVPQPKKTAQSAAAPAQGKTLPMYARVDSIDVANHTFTMKRKKDGAEIKHVATAKLLQEQKAKPQKGQN